MVKVIRQLKIEFPATQCPLNIRICEFIRYVLEFNLQNSGPDTVDFRLSQVFPHLNLILVCQELGHFLLKGITGRLVCRVSAHVGIFFKRSTHYLMHRFSSWLRVSQDFCLLNRICNYRPYFYIETRCKLFTTLKVFERLQTVDRCTLW